MRSTPDGMARRPTLPPRQALTVFWGHPSVWIVILKALRKRMDASKTNRSAYNLIISRKQSTRTGGKQRKMPGKRFSRLSPASCAFCTPFCALACCRRLPDFSVITDLVWRIYFATDPVAFCDRIGTLYDWAQQSLQGKAFQRQREAIEKLCARTGEFLLCFDYPDAYRTSRRLGRPSMPTTESVRRSENWLQNLLISLSGQAGYAHHRIR